MTRFLVPLDAVIERLEQCDTVLPVGLVNGFVGQALEVKYLDCFVGEVCHLFLGHGSTPVEAEVVGFRGETAILLPGGDVSGLKRGDSVLATGRKSRMMVSDDLMGRIIDPFGRPLDGLPPILPHRHLPLHPSPIEPASRQAITEVLHTGVGVIDGMLTVGKGQRIGIFAGSGVGKSTLLNMICEHSSSDVNVVAFVGERTREVVEFAERHLLRMKNTVVVVGAADQSPLVRRRAAFAAASVAEHFSDRGSSVLLAVDSLTRLAMAQREIGMALGEPPSSRGYPASALSILPGLLERSGNFRRRGAITGIYSVLVEGDDLTDPIADQIRALVDGHIVLSREQANKGRYPAVDILKSVSRLQNVLLGAKEQLTVRRLRSALAKKQEQQDLLDMGLYKQGTDPELDAVIQLNSRMGALFEQSELSKVASDSVWGEMHALADSLPALQTSQVQT